MLYVRLIVGELLLAGGRRALCLPARMSSALHDHLDPPIPGRSWMPGRRVGTSLRSDCSHEAHCTHEHPHHDDEYQFSCDRQNESRIVTGLALCIVDSGMAEFWKVLYAMCCVLCSHLSSVMVYIRIPESPQFKVTGRQSLEQY